MDQHKLATMTQNPMKVKALGRMIDGILRIKLLRSPTANQNLVSTKKTPCYTLGNLCRGGGTGRRAGFKIRFLHGSVGSIPTLGTKSWL